MNKIIEKRITYVKEHDVDGEFPFYFFLEFMYKGETHVSHYRYGRQYFLSAVDDYTREYFHSYGNIPEDIVAHVNEELWDLLSEQMETRMKELDEEEL